MPTLSRSAWPIEIKKASRRLARERASAAVGDGDRGHHRQLARRARSTDASIANRQAFRFKVSKTVSANRRSTPASNSAATCSVIDRHEFVERDGPIAGIVHLRRHGGGAVGGTDRAGHEARPAAGRQCGDGRPGTGHRRAVDRRDLVAQAVVGQRDALALKVLVERMSAPASR